MSKPEKKPKKMTPPKKAAKKPKVKKSEGSEPLNLKEKVTALLSLGPSHSAVAQLADLENKDQLWIVELVIPPGCFMARALPEPVDMKALDAEIDESVQALQTGSPVKNRYILFIPWCGAHGRRVVECLTEFIPEPKLPFTPRQLFDVEATFRACQ